jgi:prepilin-type N-terminal cleavage/methylation domain-containing protein
MKGLTLVELLVSMLILAIVVALSGPVFVNAYNLYQRASSSYKMHADYVTLLWNFKTVLARANDLSQIYPPANVAERMDVQELAVSPGASAPLYLTADHYLNPANYNLYFATRSFYLFKPNLNDWRTWELRYYPNAYPNAPFTTLVKGAIYDLDIFRPDRPGPETNNYNDCFISVWLRSKIKPGATSVPDPSDVHFKTALRLNARCRRAGE